MEYAFLDENNIVKQVLVFEEEDLELLNQVKNHFSLTSFMISSEDNKAKIDGELYNGKFYPEKPYDSWIRNEELAQWDSPIPYPAVEEGSDEVYIWDENTTSWLLLPPSN